MIIIDEGLTYDGFLSALRAIGVELRYNLRSDLIQWRYEGGDWLNANDRSMQALRFEIARSCGFRAGANGVRPLRFSKTDFYDCRDARTDDCEVDCFVEWLDRVPVRDVQSSEIEDFELSCDRLFEDLFGAPGEPYYRHACRAIFLTAVWRAYHPGYKVDEVTVLQGPQGAGKDAVIKAALPAERYFTDALAFNASDKEKIETTRGKVFVCASEMGGVTTTRDLEALKRWITSTADRVRLAYRRDAEDLQRRFVVIGTTNSDTPLPADATGNRRWVVVPLAHGAHVEPHVDMIRDRLWGDALALYRKGVTPNLPFEFKALQAEINTHLKRADEQIEDAFDRQDWGCHPWQMSHVASKINLVEAAAEWVRAPKQDQHRLRDVMISRGWFVRSCRWQGQYGRWWFHDGVDTSQFSWHEEA